MGKRLEGRIVTAIVCVAARLRIDEDRGIAGFVRLSDFQTIALDSLGLNGLNLDGGGDRYQAQNHKHR